MERVTLKEYEAAKEAVLYGKEYKETSNMENNVIHKQYVCKDGSGTFYERTEDGVTEFWSTEHGKSRIYVDNLNHTNEREANRMGELESIRFETQGKILELLADIQRTSAPIELSIGWVSSNNVVQQGIVIKNAPPVVTQKLIEQGYSLDITVAGVRVYKI